MHEPTNIRLSAADAELETVAANRNSPQKHVWRAKIVLLSADGVGTNEIMRAPANPRPVSGAGSSGSAKRASRVSCATRRAPRASRRWARRWPSALWPLTLAGPPPTADPLDRRDDGEGRGISASAVQRIWRAHGLQPHRVRQFKLSNDPQFVAKLRDIVGLYVDPPAHAVVLSVDEKRSHGEWIATDAPAE